MLTFIVIIVSVIYFIKKDIEISNLRRENERLQDIIQDTASGRSILHG